MRFQVYVDISVLFTDLAYIIFDVLVILSLITVIRLHYLLRPHDFDLTTSVSSLIWLWQSLERTVEVRLDTKKWMLNLKDP